MKFIVLSAAKIEADSAEDAIKKIIAQKKSVVAVIDADGSTSTATPQGLKVLDTIASIRSKGRDGVLLNGVATTAGQ